MDPYGNPFEELTPAAESITLDAFHRLARLRKIADLPNAKRRPLTGLELPLNSAFHYQGEALEDDGPSSNHPCFNKQTKSIAVQHVMEYKTEAAVRVKPGIGLRNHISDYHRLNKRMRLLAAGAKVPDDPNTLITYNYGLLDLTLLPQKVVGYWYITWRALMDTIVHGIVEGVNTTNRQQFVCIDLPKQMLTTTQLNNAKLFVPTGETYKTPPNDRRNITVFEMWQWLRHPDTTVFAPFTKLAENGTLGRVEFIFTYGEYYLVINAALLFNARKPSASEVEDHPAWATWAKETGRVNIVTLTRDLYLFLAVLRGIDAPEGIDDEEGENTDEETVVVSDSGKLDNRVAIVDKIIEMSQHSTVEQTEAKSNLRALRDEPEEDFIEALKENAALSGIITAAELRKVDRLLEKNKQLKAPNGEPLHEFTNIKLADTVLTPDEYTDQSLVLDKKMNVSTTNAFTRDYVEKLMMKDILGNINSFTKSGIIITSLDVVENKSLTETSYTISVQLGEIGGSQTTINFKVQAIQPDGTYTANGTKYQFRLQLGELPIRKINSSEVVLTSYYGKVSITRNSKRVNDFTTWLGNECVAKALDDEVTNIDGLRANSAFDNSFKSPRIYAILAKRITSLTIDGRHYNFNHRTMYARDDVKKIDADMKAKNSTAVFCGYDDAGLIYVDDTEIFTHRSNTGTLTPIGDVYQLFGIDRNRAPIEYAQVNVYSKAVPVCIALGYKLGITKLLNSLGVTYRIDYTGKKPTIDPSEFAIRFNDCAVIMSRDDTEAALIMGGFNEFRDAIAKYPMAQFDDKNVYYNVLESKYISAKHLNEIDEEWMRFIDPITKRELERINEPTTYRGLLLRSVELLCNEEYPDETSVAYSRVRGNERVAGHIYTVLSKAIKKQTRKNGKKVIDLNPYSVWQYISTDPSVMIVNEINPLEHMRGNAMLTFSGHQGRNELTMIGSTRAFHPTARGLMSEGTTDSGSVGINATAPYNPGITNLYGGISKVDPVAENNVPGIFSVNALVSPGGLHEDSKRLTFKGIQDAHTRPCPKYKPYAWRTGMDSVIANACTSDKFAIVAKEDGEVIEKTPYFVRVRYKSGKVEAYKYGKQFGVSAGTIIPMPTVCNVNEGAKFKAGTPIVHNTDFFEKDPFSPEGGLVFKFGIPVWVQLHDNLDTIEDSVAISPSLAKDLSIEVSHKRVVTVNFNDEVFDLVKIGQVVHQDDALCKMLDKAAAAVVENSDTVADTLEYLDRTTPRAKYGGVVESIQIYYHGVEEEMTESLRKLVKQSDARFAQMNPEGKAANGSSSDNFRVDGKQLSANTAAICIYITDVEPMGSSDKAVLGTQLKCTVTRVMTEILKTEDGEVIDANFGRKSVEARLVYGAYLQMTMNPVLLKITQRFFNRVLK